MKVKLNVYYCITKYLEGFKFLDYLINNTPEYIYLGEIEIENPFDVPDNLSVIQAKTKKFQEEIDNHKAQIYLLESAIKDLACIESNKK